ncbi:crossover junction endonuclease EME1B-like protein [Tanacetum coccineum]
MVAYLKKPIGSEGFQEIVDFLNGSHIRYALTKNPNIYVSLIKKFWQTDTVKIVDNGEQEINATVDGKEFTITKASVRRHRQLVDADGIRVLPNTKIFDQLALMGYVLTDDKLTFQKAKEGEGSGNPSEPQLPPSIAQPTDEEPILHIESSSPQKTQSPRQSLNKDTDLDPTTAMNKALDLIAKAFKINTIPTNNNQRSSLIPCSNQIAQSDMNTSQEIKMQMVDDNVGNQVRKNVVQNDGNEAGQNTVQNLGIQIVENMNGLSVVLEIANQYRNGNIVTAPVEGNGNGINGNPIRCYNCRGEGHYASNCTVKSRKRDATYLQQQLQIGQEEEAGI